MNSGDQIFTEIARAVGMYTTALFPITSDRDICINPPGTGTFVSVDNRHYIMTAAHVWSALEKAKTVGLALREGLDHQFSIPAKAIVPCGPMPPKDWNEWGPDLVLLRVPPELVGQIAVHRVFYNLGRDRQPRAMVGARDVPLKEALDVLARSTGDVELENRVLMGTPADLATFSPKHASVMIDGIFVGFKERVHRVGGFDYVDLLDIKITSPAPVRDFRGISGGGLWRCFTAKSAETGQNEIVKILEGVAFYELDVENGCGTIRCHGRQSIETLMTYAPSS